MKAAGRVFRGLRGELRIAALPGGVAIALVAAVVAGTAVRAYLDGRRRYEVPAAFVELGDPAGTLRAAAWQYGTLPGIVFAAVVGGVLFARPLEEGSWGLVRLHERRVGLLVVRKLLTTLLLAAVGIVVAAVTVWVSCRVAMEMRPYPADARVPLPEAAAVPWGEAWTAVFRGVAALTGYTALAACAAGITRGMLSAMAMSAGSLLVTAPLVLVEIRQWTPAYWVAAGLDLPEEAQGVAYLWSSAPSTAAPADTWPLLVVVTAAALAAAWVALRAERSLAAT
ncbi:hypothetical protein ACFW9F_05355 [Streptomyces sp. NPDC059506]|uniref:hypothetical protein n=1 Tax=Streptomyces TaxID=1883 RepID=UPI0022AA2E91|nr:hypothetical protein [Streptomyces sp. HB2AG]MCZ2525660.1 hypothetical protein [Streptomyces sp. HB2AG]